MRQMFCPRNIMNVPDFKKVLNKKRNKTRVFSVKLHFKKQSFLFSPRYSSMFGGGMVGGCDNAES